MYEKVLAYFFFLIFSLSVRSILLLRIPRQFTIVWTAFFGAGVAVNQLCRVDGQ
jgi:hypothetical protein